MTSSQFRVTIAAILLMVPLGACAVSNQRPSTGMPLKVESTASPDRLVEVGNGLLEKGQYRDAANFFNDALSKQPDHVTAKLGMAESLLGVGAFEAAQNVFSELASVSEVSVPARQGVGISLLLLGQPDKAREILSAVVSQDASAWRAWNALARCYDLNEDWARSSHAYAMALKAKPDAQIVHNNLGMSLLSQARYTESEASFRAAVGIQPDFDVARNNLRFAIAMQGRYRDAFAGTARNDMPLVLNNVGYAAMLRGEKDRAQAYFLRAIEASPHFFEVAYNNLQRVKGSGDQAQ